jgi:plastocyanin
MVLTIVVVGGFNSGFLVPAQATTNNVNVGDDFFSPQTVTINVNDSVQWTWIGTLGHNTTGPGTPALWASATQSSGSFTHQFGSAGSFAYVCTIHVAFGMHGTVNVQAADVPPTVSLTSPTNGAIFAAPWTGSIQGSDSDSDGTVTQVVLFAGATKVGTVGNPPASFNFGVTNLAAGNYTLSAVATDNGGATNTSAGIAIQVLTPVPILLSSPQRTSPTSFQFLYTATPGLSYVVKRSGELPNFIPIHTNRASSSPVTFLDSQATGGLNFYSVTLVPNP